MGSQLLQNTEIIKQTDILLWKIGRKYGAVSYFLSCTIQLEMCSTVLKKCGHAKSHASLLVVAMVHLLWLSGSCSCYFSHTFETRDRIRKIECIKVKAESRARREREQSMAASMAARAYLFQEIIK